MIFFFFILIKNHLLALFFFINRVINISGYLINLAFAYFQFFIFLFLLIFTIIGYFYASFS
jgi:hypothetical protein